MDQMRSGRPYGVILCATRFTPTCNAAVEIALGIARRFGSRLVLMHVAERRAAAPEASRRLEALAARVPDLAIETAIAYGEPGHAVARTALHEHVDLVVVGKARSSGALVQLSMEEVLARTTPCFVLTIDIGDTLAGAMAHLENTLKTELHCLVCAKESAARICRSCSTRITAEAMGHKHRIDKAASTGR